MAIIACLPNNYIKLIDFPKILRVIYKTNKSIFPFRNIKAGPWNLSFSQAYNKYVNIIVVRIDKVDLDNGKIIYIQNPMILQIKSNTY